MANRVYQRMKPYIASRHELQENYYPLNGSSFMRISGRDDNPEVFAIDCEMCKSVKNGRNVKEVVKITIVDHNLQVVYETLVRPRYQVINYKSDIHGISENEILRSGVPLADVHNFLERNFYSNTIIVGHSLEHDFKAINLMHEAVVDTSLVYPKRMTGDKQSLKELAKNYLGKSIRREGYDDSCEDAITAMELMLKKI